MKKENVKLTTEQEELLLKSNEEDYAKIFPLHTRSFLRKCKRELKKKAPLPIKEQIENDKKKIFESEKERQLQKKYKELIKQNEGLKKKLDAYLQIRDATKSVVIKKTPSRKSEAMAMLIASDWHYEEEVKPGTINGLNKFNLEIARKRIEAFFINSIRLVKKEQKDIEIKNIVLALLGDFISGNIHEELLSVCQLDPINAIIEVQSLIAGGIDYILKNTDCDIIIPCVAGNHSRITKKINKATEIGNSLETFMYNNLAWNYRDNKRVKFILQEGYFVYLDAYGFKIRFHHGHNMKYHGGVNGIGVPINKAINEWNKSIFADIDIFGHWHQKLDGGNYVCNGSLIGYNAYALSIKASCVKPTQTFFLLDKEEGKTIVAPILLN